MPIARCARFDVPVQRTTNFSRWLPIALTTWTRRIREMEFDIGELPGRSAVVVWSDFDGEHCGAFPRFLARARWRGSRFTMWAARLTG